MPFPSWLESLRQDPDLAATGFRLLPNDVVAAVLAGDQPVRIGTSGALPANSRGIGLILYPGHDDQLYARFADDALDEVGPAVEAPSNWMAGALPLVEIPIEPTVQALAGLAERYVRPGRTLPPPGPFVGMGLKSAAERVIGWHENFRRFRIPLGTIPGEEDPYDAFDDVAEIERRLIFNGFLAIYQWCLMTGNYTTDDGDSFTVPYTSTDTAYSRSLFTLDGRFSDAGCHLTLEIDYSPEPDTDKVRHLRAQLTEQMPDFDQLPDDLPYDAMGAVAAMRLKPQPLAEQHNWAAEGDAASLLSLYFHISGNDLLDNDEVHRQVRQLIEPLANSPHDEIRMAVAALAKRHNFADLE